MQYDHIVEVIRRFIIEETNLEDESFLQNDTNLFEAGLLDSLLIVNLIALCDDELNCQIDTADVSEENFSSLNAIATLICSKIPKH